MTMNPSVCSVQTKGKLAVVGVAIGAPFGVQMGNEDGTRDVSIDGRLQVTNKEEYSCPENTED